MLQQQIDHAIESQTQLTTLHAPADLVSNLQQCDWWLQISDPVQNQHATLKVLQQMLSQIVIDPDLAIKILPRLVKALQGPITSQLQLDLLETINKYFFKSNLQWAALSSDTVLALVEALTKTNVPKLAQRSRFLVLSIYQSFTMHKALLIDRLQHPSVFIAGVLQAVNQEKDPRNLMIAFDLVRYLLSTFMTDRECVFDSPLQELQFADDFYEFISCYFPINFTPPKNDPFGVAPAILKQMLASCFTASPKLAAHLAPFFCDKMKVKAIETKLESIEILSKLVPSLDDKMLSKTLSAVSHVYFRDVSDAQVQPSAGRLIGLLLNQMLPQGVAFGVGVQSDLYHFVSRCVSDIEQAPDSMQAGLSAVLMQHVSQCSEHMQRLVAERVFLRLTGQLLADTLPSNKRVAFTSVLTGLLDKAGATFLSLTANEPIVAQQLQLIVFAHLQIKDNEAMALSWQQKEPMELVLYEKTLYLAQSLFKHAGTAAMQRPVLSKCAQVLHQTYPDSGDVKFKMCFAMLQSHAEVDAAKVSQVIRVFFTDLEPMFELGLLRSEQDVRESLQQYTGDIRFLKPLAFCRPSAAINQMILDTISSSVPYQHLKLMLAKVQVADTTQLTEVCSQLPKVLAVQALTFIAKHKGFVAIDPVLALFQTDVPFSKLMFFVILRCSAQQQTTVLKAAIEQLLQSSDTLVKLVVCKALVVSGNQLGYTELKRLVACPPNDLADHFSIICRELPSAVTVANGFKVNRLYAQRLYAQLRPALDQIKETDLGVQLLIQTFTLVSSTQIPSDLTPLAARALTRSASPSVQSTCLHMFVRVIKSDIDNELKLEYLELFLSKILELLCEVESLTLAAECLTVLTTIATAFPSFVLLPHSQRVQLVAEGLKSHRKRVVRKFARGVINEWAQLK